MATAIASITKHAERIRRGDGKVQPGEPHIMSEALTDGDIVAQGDLYLRLIEEVPEWVQLVQRPRAVDRQLVPGNTQGAKHCLDSLRGVELYQPDDWSENYEGLLGPVLVLKESRVITHPTHGDVTLPANTIVQCGYQREWDAEQRRERRNAD